MHHDKNLRKSTLFFNIFLINLILITGSCVTNKNKVSDFPVIELFAEAVPEGILLSFSNYKEIPSDIAEINIYFRDWGIADKSVWDKPLDIDFMKSMSIIRESYCERALEQVRMSGKVLFPFVQTGHNYNVTAYFLDNEFNVVSSITTDCIADDGIYLYNDITLELNNVNTGVELSSEPTFSSEIQSNSPNLSYQIIGFTGEYTEAITSGLLTNDLLWNFEPMFSTYLKDVGIKNGNYPAFVTAKLHITYNELLWMLEIAKTPVFNFSF